MLFICVKAILCTFRIKNKKIVQKVCIRIYFLSNEIHVRRDVADSISLTIQVIAALKILEFQYKSKQNDVYSFQGIQINSIMWKCYTLFFLDDESLFLQITI